MQCICRHSSRYGIYGSYQRQNDKHILGVAAKNDSEEIAYQKGEQAISIVELFNPVVYMKRMDMA